MNARIALSAAERACIQNAVRAHLRVPPFQRPTPAIVFPYRLGTVPDASTL